MYISLTYYDNYSNLKYVFSLGIPHWVKLNWFNAHNQVANLRIDFEDTLVGMANRIGLEFSNEHLSSSLGAIESVTLNGHDSSCHCQLKSAVYTRVIVHYAPPQVRVLSYLEVLCYPSCIRLERSNSLKISSTNDVSGSSIY